MKINLLGINIPIKKNVIFGIKKFYGIGIKTSIKILNLLKINKEKKMFQLTDLEKTNILNYIKNMIIENDLRILIKDNLKKIINLNNYKSLRHKKKLPCRGQRTKTNAKTRKKMNHEKI